MSKSSQEQKKPYEVSLLGADDVFLENHIEETKALADKIKSPIVTREMSLYVLLNTFPHLVEKLEQHSVEGKDFYRKLQIRYNVYERSGIPNHVLHDHMGPPDEDLEDEGLRSGSDSIEIDSEMLEILYESLSQLKDENSDVSPEAVAESREYAHLNAFIKGAYQTYYKAENENAPHEKPFKYKRSDLMEKYLFHEDGILDDLAYVLGDEYLAALEAQEKAETTKKNAKSSKEDGEEAAEEEEEPEEDASEKPNAFLDALNYMTQERVNRLFVYALAAYSICMLFKNGCNDAKAAEQTRTSFTVTAPKCENT